MKPFSPLMVFLVVGGCVALNFIQDPYEYLGACFVYALLLGGGNLVISDFYGENNDKS